MKIIAQLIIHNPLSRRDFLSIENAAMECHPSAHQCSSTIDSFCGRNGAEAVFPDSGFYPVSGERPTR